MKFSHLHLNKIDGEFLYSYNVETGLNDCQNHGRQVAVAKEILML